MTGPERRVEVALASGGYCRCSFFAMGSPCELLVDTDEAEQARPLADTVAAEAWRVEDKFSRYRPDNIVATINDGGPEPARVDSETADLIDFAETLYGLSDGRFDITSGVLRRAWTFDGSDRVPTDEEVNDLLVDVGWPRVRWRRPAISLPEGMQIDFGGIGKEYAVDRAARLIADVIGDAAGPGCLINFGGDLAAVGPARSPQGWQVGIESLREDDASADRRINLKSGALATSGDARRFVLRDGVRYGHILDPTTGWPVVGAPRSITVAADTCTEAGMLATLAMLNGPDAERWLTDAGVQFWALR